METFDLHLQYILSLLIKCDFDSTKTTIVITGIIGTKWPWQLDDMNSNIVMNAKTTANEY